MGLDTHLQVQSMGYAIPSPIISWSSFAALSSFTLLHDVYLIESLVSSSKYFTSLLVEFLSLKKLRFAQMSDFLLSSINLINKNKKFAKKVFKYYSISNIFQYK